MCRVHSHKKLGHKFYLVRCNCNKLSGRKRKCFDDFLSSTSGTNVSALHFDNVNSRLILVEAVEEDVAFAGRLVGKFDLSKTDRLLRPVAAIIRRVRVNVDCVTWGRFCFPT